MLAKRWCLLLEIQHETKGMLTNTAATKLAITIIFPIVIILIIINITITSDIHSRNIAVAINVI